LGGAFARVCEERALPFCLTARDELDIGDEASIAAAIAAHEPWAVINTAGFVRVADAEREPEACIAANADGPEKLAHACRKAGIPLVTFSSDLVFDGALGRPYLEDDAVAPACVYGASKAEAERRVLAAGGDALVVRTSAFFGPWDRYNFAWHVLSALARGEAFQACAGTEVSPTYVPDLCHATLDLLVDGEKGIWHLANAGRVSWYEFARRIAQGAGYDPDRIEAIEDGAPAVTALASTRGALLRPVEEAIEAFLRDAEALPQAEASPLELAAE
jgi:dTDP-4-dehydrorhamnose reductase